MIHEVIYPYRHFHSQGNVHLRIIFLQYTSLSECRDIFLLKSRTIPFPLILQKHSERIPPKSVSGMEGNTQCEQNWQLRFERPLQPRHVRLFVVDWWHVGRVA
jgi:hypothetical protein